MYDIWKGLSALLIRTLFTRSNEIHEYDTTHAAKGTYLRKEVKFENFTRSLIFRELEQHYGIIFLHTGEIYSPSFYFETLSDRDGYVEVGTLTRILKFIA